MYRGYLRFLLAEIVVRVLSARMRVGKLVLCFARGTAAVDGAGKLGFTHPVTRVGTIQRWENGFACDSILFARSVPEQQRVLPVAGTAE